MSKMVVDSQAILQARKIGITSVVGALGSSFSLHSFTSPFRPFGPGPTLCVAIPRKGGTTNDCGQRGQAGHLQLDV